MGKKRRYIQRARKFAQKYFKILDGFDGDDDSEIQKYDAFIDTLVATDLGNQTVQLTGRVLGKASTVADLGIEYSFDSGVTFTAVNSAIADQNTSDIDEWLFDTGTGASAIGIGAALDVKTHTVIVRPKSIADTQRQKKVSFAIKENEIAIGGIAAAFTDDDADNIAFDASDLTIAGKKLKGDNTAASFGNPSTNRIKIEIFRDGAAQTLTGGALSLTINNNTNFPAANDATILVTALAGVAAGTVVTYLVRITPSDSANTVLAGSVAEASITVTKAA